MPFDITRVRPSDDSADAISEALAAVAEARSDANSRLAQAAADRSRLLAEGSNREIARAEQAAHDARLDLERLAALEPQLHQKLQEARSREREATEQELLDHAAAAVERFNAWWRAEYEAHARAIAEGLKLEVEAQEAIHRAVRFDRSLDHRVARPDRAYCDNQAGSPSAMIRLPGVESGTTIAWPPVVPDINAAYRR